MRTFTNNIGCKMSFDDDVSFSQIKEKMLLFGKRLNWFEDKNGVLIPIEESEDNYCDCGNKFKSEHEENIGVCGECI